jgi:hypothetical protein
VRESRDECKERLPAAVYDLALRLGADPQQAPSGAQLTQSGRMKRKLDAETWMKFTAKQTISANHCAFDWRARFGPFGMLAVRDAVDGQDAHLDVMLLGFIPVMHAASSPMLIRGELMRYLAEIALLPDAILLNTALRWRVDGPETIAVSAGTGAGAAEVIFGLDSEGRILSAFAPDRPRSVTPPYLPTPWRGRFSNYRQHCGRWLPFDAEVGWEIDGKSRRYWQGRMDTWETS